MLVPPLAMGSCLSKCYSGSGPALTSAEAEADAVKEKHVVVVSQSPPLPPPPSPSIPLPSFQIISNKVNVCVSSSSYSSCSSSVPSSPNPSASPSNSFSSLSANCSSCHHSPLSSKFKESAKGLYLHQTALLNLPEKLYSSQATKQLLGRGNNNKLQVRAARVGERRSSPAAGSRTAVLRSVPKLERSKSLATGGRVAARKKSAGRAPMTPGKSTSRPGRLSCRKQEEEAEMHAMQCSHQKREIIGRRWRDGFDVDQGQSYAVEDLNNPLISMDCFIFI